MKKYRTQYKFAFGLALLAVFLLIWINLAVGIIGDSEDLANLLYIGVIAIGFIGSIIARIKPKGMSRALIVTTGAQILVPIIVLFTGMHLDNKLGIKLWQ